MTTSLIIDISLTLLFLVILYVCYRRGLFRTLVTALKFILSIAGAYFLQDFLSPVIQKFIPANTAAAILSSQSPLAGGLFDRFFQVIIGNLITSFILFIALFVLLTLLGNLLLGVLDRFVLTKMINRAGGLIAGVAVGVLSVVLVSYIISIALLTSNGSAAITSINESVILNLVVGNNIDFILSNLVR